MLTVRFSRGNQPDLVYDPDSYFDSIFEPKFLESQFAHDIIADVDKSEVLSPYCIQSPVLGQIPPQFIAGGTKTVILMYEFPNMIFNASACGNNCAKWILKAAEEKDITIRLGYCMEFPEPFRIRFEQTGKVATTQLEFIDCFCEAQALWDGIV